MSVENVNSHLKETEDDLNMITNAEKRLKIIDSEIDIVEHDIRAQGKKMKEELGDVQRLEKNGMSSLFKKILGDHEQQLEKERQEYLQEVLSYNSLIDELEVLKYEQNILLSKVSRKREVEETYKILIAEKEEKIKVRHPKIAKELKKMDALISVSNQFIKETEEAIESGNDVLKHLNFMIENLKYVKQWGLYRMQGKGRYSSYEKKGYVDKAQKLVGVVQVKFNIFEKELKDLYPDYDLNMDNYHFKAFVDNFYDGLITDWIIVKKLQVALNGTVAATHKVNRLLSMLSAEKEKTETILQSRTEQRTQFVIDSNLSK